MVRYFCQSLDPFLPRIRAIHPDITGSVPFERLILVSFLSLSLSPPFSFDDDLKRIRNSNFAGIF